MSNSAAETVIGAVVLIAAAGFLTFAAQNANFGGGSETLMLEAKFRKADGINIGTDVRLAGVKIGSVADLALDPQTYQAIATLSITEQIDIPEDTDAKIAADGLLGGNYVALTPGGSPFMLANGDEVVNTQGSVSLLDLLLKFGTSAQ